MDSVYALHLATTFFMTGLIWVVQLVHYPSFLFVPEKKFAEFVGFHGSRITWIVLPVMLLELGTAVALELASSRLHLWSFNLVALLLIWLCTIGLSIPCHRRLAAGWDEALVKRLIATNWPRTILWTLRSFLIIGFLASKQIFSFREAF